jgi:hypothetical protein
MKDLHDREILVGDRCVFSDKHGRLDSRPIRELHSDDDCPENDYVEIADYHETLTKKAKEIIDITAIEREVREQQFINSVKALDIKPNDRIIASLNPNQVPMEEAKNIFNQMKKMFPDNKVSLVVGVDVTIEKGEEGNDRKTI